MRNREAEKGRALQVEDVHVFYGDSHIIQGASLGVGRECVCLLGRNGMGKTTLLRSIMALTPAREGSIRFNQKEIAHLKPFEVASQGIGYVPQGRRLFPSLSVDEHLRLTYREDSGRHSWTPTRVYEFFPELVKRRHISGTRLSGGEQQMLAIGRALVTNPKMLILDEPSEGLSPVAVDRVIEIVEYLVHEARLSVLLVEQAIRVAEAVADRAYIMTTGKIAVEVSGDELRSNESIRHKYLGV